MIILNGVGQGIAGQIAVLLRPAGGLGDLVIEGGGGEDLGEQRIGIKRDALHELVEPLRGQGSGRGRLLGVLRLAALLRDKDETAPGSNPDIAPDAGRPGSSAGPPWPSDGKSRCIRTRVGRRQWR